MAGSNVWVKSGNVLDILSGATTTTVGSWRYKDSPHATFQATVEGTGAVSATVEIQVSNDGVNACETEAGTIILSGTTSSSDGFTTQHSPWKYVRAEVTAISGTGASVSVKMGV